MATSHTNIYSDEIINIKCCLCAEKNRTTEGDKYCVECKNYYCTPCTELHNQFPSMKGHKHLDKQDFRSLGSDESLPSFVTQRCSLHPSKVLDMFCKDHDEVACASCIALNHRNCNDIQSIQEEVDNMYNRTELTNVKQKIYQTKNSLEAMKADKEKKLIELKEEFEKEVESVKAFRQELKTLLDNMEQETIKELKKEFDKIQSILTIEINENNKLIDEINEVASQLRKTEGNKVQEFVSIKNSVKVTTKADGVMMEQMKIVKGVVFTPDQNIKASLLENPVLGIVLSYKHPVTHTKDSLYKANNQKEIYIKLVNDKSTCNMEGSCLTEDDFVLLADRTNKKLKRLDMSTDSVKDYINLSAVPYAVCLVSKTVAAVTLENKTVQFVTLGKELTATSTLTLNHSCYGLAYKDDKLFVSDGSKTVYIYNKNGKQLKTISKDASGKKLFNCNRHIAVSAHGVFVADNDKFLVILDHDGNYLSTLKDPTVNGPHGVCTDGKNLFVSGFFSNNIVQIGHDYKLLGKIGEVTGPRSLCFDHHQTRLIVTHNNNKITVMDLK